MNELFYEVNNFLGKNVMSLTSLVLLKIHIVSYGIMFFKIRQIIDLPREHHHLYQSTI